jgi:methanogenic corrinoid protein MtbC1
MPQSGTVEEYISPLLAGDRAACREFVLGKLAGMNNPLGLYHEVLWPAMERVDRLYRADRINTAAEHMATRINRAIADQIQTRLPQAPRNGRRIIITCAEGEPEELGAQMCADLFESRGWKVYFLGGGVPNDEVLKVVGQFTPDILLIFGTQPSGVPGVRKLVDMIRDIGLNPTMNIMVSGGVFNRADGLWREVSADLVAKTAQDAIEMAESATPREPGVTRQASVKRRRRRRRAAEPETSEQAA